MIPVRAAHTDGDTLVSFPGHDILTVRDKVAPLVAQGKTLEEVLASKPTAQFDAQVPNAAQSAERFVRWLYAELKNPR